MIFAETATSDLNVSLIITTALAVAGLLVTVTLTLLQRRDTTRIHQRTYLHESSRQLASNNPAERAVGMAAAIDHLGRSRLGISARRIMINALHYEDDPLIIYRGLQGLSNPKLSKTVIEELLIINRQLWHDLLEEFGILSLDSEPEAKRGHLEQRLGVLRHNQRLASHLLQGKSFKGLDFSNTFYPDLQAPGIVFTDCTFRSCLLHYSNLRAASFRGCDLSRSILIGSYMEDIQFDDCELTEAIALSARLHLVNRRGDALLPPELRNSFSAPWTSFVYEIEQDWRGYWFGETTASKSLLTRRQNSSFVARWQNTSGDEVTARIIMEGHEAFHRKQSSDGNDGKYKITRREPVDRSRSVTLVGGTRVLKSGIPSGWRALWWERLYPKKLPISSSSTPAQQTGEVS